MLLVHYLALKGIALTARNNRVEVHEDLDLSALGRIILPEQLEVAGSLYLDDSQVEALPAHLRVQGNLDISNTGIRELPADTRVRGSIYLRNCQLDVPLPFYDVYGDLDLSGASLPGLQRGLRVHGSLNLFRTRMPELPDDLVVDQVLYMVDSSIKRLPSNLHVGKNLVVSEGLLTHGLPPDLYVGGKQVGREWMGMVSEVGLGHRHRAMAAVASLV